METEFGAVPYRACQYGEIDEVTDSLGHSHPHPILLELLRECKRGDFHNASALASLMVDSSYDVRQYSQQLFAHVCNHAMISSFERVFDVVQDAAELCRFAVRLGETLSLQAIPLILGLQTAYDDDDLAGYIWTAVRMIYPLDDLSEERIRSDDIGLLYAPVLERANASHYYYRGRPVIVGDVTKELVEASLIANRSGGSVVLINQPQILSNFSGLQCPIVHGQEISDGDVNAVLTYVEKLAELPWTRGSKYFYKHIIQ